MQLPRDPVRVAVIGVGDISDIYLDAIHRSPVLTLVSVAGRGDQRARQVAADRGVRADSIEGMLSDESVELVVDLAPASVHEDLNARIIHAGKHLYSEKPMALSRECAVDLTVQARRRGVKVGGAPDTFFGAAHQAVRRLLDANAIGTPALGTAFVGHPGIEWFHPDPTAFYRPGAETPFDIGPYHIVQWINLLGPVRKVFAASSIGAQTRVVRHGPRVGEPFKVTVPTSFSIVMTFDRASVSLVLSLDVLDCHPRPSELFGSDGVLFLTDPNVFGGEPAIFRPANGRQPIDLSKHPFGVPNRSAHDGSLVANYRGVGLVDMALALRRGGTHRTAPDLLIHTAEVAEAMVRSARSGHSVDIVSTCERPAPLGVKSSDVMLRDAMPTAAR